MCDYSLHDVVSRPAKVGDELMTTRFKNSATRGFCAVRQPEVAVCLMPGTEVAFEQEAESSHPFRKLLPRFRFGKIGATVARFRQVNMEHGTMHHDALEFANGKIVLVTLLRPGQRATVLQLPAVAKAVQLAKQGIREGVMT
jgi:hypothetical protein